MQVSLPQNRPVSPRADRLIRSGIVLAGMLCFLLLAWVHLGLGAFLAPPPPTVATQHTTLGADKLTIAFTSGELTATGANTVTFTLQNAGNQPVTHAQMQITPVMTTMAMSAPTVTLTPQGATGAYVAQLRFGMAGSWKLHVALLQSGLPSQTTNIPVTVRW